MDNLNFRPQIWDAEIFVGWSFVNILADDTLLQLLLQNVHLNLVEVDAIIVTRDVVFRIFGKSHILTEGSVALDQIRRENA